MNIAILMTCHNRREKTLACLDALYLNRLPSDVSIDVFLVDDGSTDGTYEIVAERFPGVRILHGDGKLFWNRGMHKAFGLALTGDFDAFLWLNDDTILYPDALERILQTWEYLREQQGQDAIVVGSTRDPMTGVHTYGGVVRPSRWKPMSYTVLVVPIDHPVACQTMNGNCVLIPRGVAEVVGNLDPSFSHAMGDTDYGLRARKAGFPVFILPGYAGTCAKNSQSGGFNDGGLLFGPRWKKMMQPKGLPPGPWWIFTRRHAGMLWLAYWAWPYFRVAVSSLFRARRSKGRGW